MTFRILSRSVLCGIVLTLAFSGHLSAQSRVDHYSATPFQATWTDISATADTFHYNNGAAGYGKITLPFDFIYDDSTIKSGSPLLIGAAGSISFLPDSMPAQNVAGNLSHPGQLCVFSAQIVEGKGTSTFNVDYYQVDGMAPNRVLTVQYHFAHMPGTGSGGGGGGGGGGKGGNPQMMQVKLYETTGVIEFIYDTHNSQWASAADSANLGTIGLNGFSTPKFLAKIFATNLNATPSTDVRWTPAGSSATGDDLFSFGTPFAEGHCGPDTAVIDVTNAGTDTVHYIAMLMGPDAKDFNILGRAASFAVPPQHKAAFPIRFVPSRTTAETAYLFVSGGETVIDTIIATGQGATITGSGTAPATPVGQTSQEFNVTVNNTGTCDWTPGSPISSDPHFIYVAGGASTIPAGGSGNLVYTYTPTPNDSGHTVLSFPNAIGFSVPAPDVEISVGSGVSDRTSTEGYVLSQCFPNPAGNSTQCSFTVPVASRVRFVLLDAAGRVIRTEIDRYFNAGSYDASFDLDGLPSGSYFCQLISGTTTLTRPLRLIR